MKHMAIISGLTLTLLTAGCVTINVYFPAAAAEKAADRLIDDIWQSGVPDKSSGETEETGSPAQDTQQEKVQ